LIRMSKRSKSRAMSAANSSTLAVSMWRRLSVKEEDGDMGASEAFDWSETISVLTWP
jgi:hypothetical protein